MRPPHVRLRYLIPLTIVTGFLTAAYLVWTSHYDVRFLNTGTVRPAVVITTDKYAGTVGHGHEKRNDIFGRLGKIKKQYLETEYQTKPPGTGSFISVEEEERMRKMFVRHRQMQKEFDRKKEVFRQMKKTTKSTRDLKSRLHYHVDQRATLDPSQSSLLKTRHGGSVKLTYVTGDVRPESCEKCMDLDVQYMINPNRLCATNADRIKALVLIFSEPGHENVRQAIRDTWGSLARKTTGPIRVAFLFGRLSDKDWTKIHAESLQYQDILVGDFVDSFRNLTIKTIMGLRWAVDYCPAAQFLAKTDDDMWLNLPKFFTVAKTLDLRNVVTGTCYEENWKPHRDPESKYYVSDSEYPNDEYPLLCTGTAYIMTMHVAQRIAFIQPDIPYFHLEDVYIALCRKRLGIGVLPLQGCFNYKEIFEKCTYRNEVIASHWITPDEMHEAWDSSCDGRDVIRDYLTSKS